MKLLKKKHDSYYATVLKIQVNQAKSKVSWVVAQIIVELFEK